MSQSIPIKFPSGYAPGYAFGFADAARNVVLVDQTDRLPVAVAPDAPPALEGTAEGTQQAGPFAAVPGRPISVTLGGTWEGTVTLLRSTDGGATRNPLRVGGLPWGVFASNGCEQAWVETETGVTFYLDITLASGTLAYRVSQ